MCLEQLIKSEADDGVAGPLVGCLSLLELMHE